MCSVDEGRAGAARGWAPDSMLSGRLLPPGSKSIAQRAIAAALLLPPEAGPVDLEQLPTSDDVSRALEVAGALGARLERPGADRARLTGAGPGRLGHGRESVRLALGESGTLARLTSALVALQGAPGSRFDLAGDGSLDRRESAALFAALRSAGAGLQTPAEREGWPVRIMPAGQRARLLGLAAPRSSQELSALLLTAAGWRGTTLVEVVGKVPSAPYVGLTTRVLAAFGADVERADTGSWSVRGPLSPPTGGRLVVESDASAAAVALAAACLSGGELRVDGIPADSSQGDVRVLEHLAAFGCRAERSGEALSASGRPVRGARLDLSGEPDLAPVLAVVAAAAARSGAGPSELSGLGTLAGKESDRLLGLALALRAAGLEVRVGDDTLWIASPPGGAGAVEPTVLDPRGDHRMAFAHALLGLVVPGISTSDPGCVAKSWPGFWEDLEALGARRASG